MTTVIINGYLGKMGTEAVKAVTADANLTLVAQTDKNDSLSEVIQAKNPDVVVDLTHPSTIFENCKSILKSAHAVIGTTGLTTEQLTNLDTLAKDNNKGVFVIPNFAIGAILMMKFAKEASKYMERVEIIEYHHDKKADAPSGTAIKTAELIAEGNSEINSTPLDETEIIEGARGATKNNIPIHSVRLPGHVADQSVIFGAQGQKLTLSHDTISREAFMPGLIVCIKKIGATTGLTYGLENILFSS
ncbi:4-hydroxy-tetrahydrodipicolinate reductase [Candidatus Marinamargulisbacteria bacterium SCGC AAA071-K20]|nr:4-hydroxy-tetrahydrodipicolinate reductase [Candidatus Marinamargulisbacteria bacterium SCGC AAA071-K20]